MPSRSCANGAGGCTTPTSSIGSSPSSLAFRRRSASKATARPRRCTSPSGGARVGPGLRRRPRGWPPASRWRGCWGDVLTDCLAVIYEVDPSGSWVVAKAARGQAARTVVGHRMLVGQGVSGWVSANNHAIDDTDAALDLAGVLPAAEIAGLSCTSVPMSVAGRRIVVTVYGPRSGTAQRAALVRGLNQYLQTAVQPGSQSAPVALTAVDMAKAS